ncbi:hypothetical protein D0B54_11585 [Solimonas sp. K1W22B-7]|uniref:hypothetical protein n=1 Tax=Solimonas sp. K1W22B-7 TaxID=2303331 RepID=UPI000E3368A4|nr:hypothetical protein [Solimonas sp. K1W22B-7]AXQ29292.1 hypothetical protein D0B54_11585 [Solimonas sp. K1W22B-7]
MTRMMLLALLLMLGGCAANKTLEYHSAQPKIAVQTRLTVNVGVHDERPYVISRDKPVDFVGLARSRYGVPWNVKTTSGRPLATDFGETVTAALTRQEVRARQILLDPTKNGRKERETLLATGADRYLLLTLVDWRSDTMVNTALIYDLRLQIFDRRGVQLAQASLRGNDALDGQFFNRFSKTRSDVPSAYRQKLESLFAQPQIARALSP